MIIAGALAALGQVVMIDLVLAGDNALVIGALAARLPERERARAVTVGIAVAIAARLIFSLGASLLLAIPLIGALGGMLLLWIAWKLYRDLADNNTLDGSTEAKAAPTSFLSAVRAICVADISMSLDNVLGVAGAAAEHRIALVFGLILSMVLMGGAATWIAGQMSKRPWLIWIGIATIVAVAIKMIWSGIA